MKTDDQDEIVRGLMAWALASPSRRARAIVPELVDIHRASQQTAKLIEELQSAKTATEQIHVLGQLEVWMFDELSDRMASIRPRLDAVSRETSRAAG